MGVVDYPRKIAQSLVDRFTGSEIRSYHATQANFMREWSDEPTQEINAQLKKKRQDMLHTVWLPNIATASGLLMMGVMRNPAGYLLGGALATGSEALRQAYLWGFRANAEITTREQETLLGNERYIQSVERVRDSAANLLDEGNETIQIFDQLLEQLRELNEGFKRGEEYRRSAVEHARNAREILRRHREKYG